jgi:hypothetical protein
MNIIIKLNEIKMNKWATLYIRRQTRMHREPWTVNDHFGDKNVLGRILLKYNSKEQTTKVVNRIVWLRTGKLVRIVMKFRLP